jgi:hypothetical protein
MRICLAAIAVLSMLALAACTSAEPGFDVMSAEGPTPPAPVGVETAARTPVAFAADPRMEGATLPPAPAQPMEPAVESAPIAPPAMAQSPAPTYSEPQAAPPAPPAAPAQMAARPVASAALVQVAPIVGATPRAVTPLSQRLALRAAERGISLSNRAGGSHVLRGYFSAMEQDGNAVVIYVWDVLDGGGNRVHRIQGQESVRMPGSDPWSAVSNRTMETIADRTVDDLAAWLGGQAG